MGTSDPALLTALMIARELSADTAKSKDPVEGSTEYQGPLS